MARIDFENLEDAINYIKENEERIDNYDTVNTTFNNYKKNTDIKIEKFTKENEDLQKANMTLYLQTCQDTKKADTKTEEPKETLDDIINEL